MIDLYNIFNCHDINKILDYKQKLIEKSNLLIKIQKRLNNQRDLFIAISMPMINNYFDFGLTLRVFCFVSNSNSDSVSDSLSDALS